MIAVIISNKTKKICNFPFTLTKEEFEILKVQDISNVIMIVTKNII